MDKEILAILAEKWLNGTATETEKQTLHAWYDTWKDEDLTVPADRPQAADDVRSRILSKIQERMQDEPARVVPMRKRRWGIVAASVAAILVAAVGAWLYFRPVNQNNLVAMTPAKAADVAAPATRKAILTLSDGRKIVLDSAGQGAIAVQGKVNISKQADGQLAYKGAATAAVTYNTLTVPRGSQPMTLVLADGSKVWLNVASSITYPTAFSGSKREVQLTGEAYFEVTHRSDMPFYVKGNGLNVQVLGTHFNVNAYPDEKDARVTLLEGAVKVAKAGSDVVLKPGEQAVSVAGQAGMIAVSKDVDLDEVMAWKNGRFEFDGNDIGSVMRQIGRWYDVDVEYQGEPSVHFVGGITRLTNVSDVLKMLEQTKAVHFTIEGRKIIVSK